MQRESASSRWSTIAPLSNTSPASYGFSSSGSSRSAFCCMCPATGCIGVRTSGEGCWWKLSCCSARWGASRCVISASSRIIDCSHQSLCRSEPPRCGGSSSGQPPLHIKGSVKACWSATTARWLCKLTTVASDHMHDSLADLSRPICTATLQDTWGTVRQRRLSCRCRCQKHTVLITPARAHSGVLMYA